LTWQFGTYRVTNPVTAHPRQLQGGGSPVDLTSSAAWQRIVHDNRPGIPKKEKNLYT
jgi:hypothetical protein